jgi:16S rRNA (guanine527-N7)-methyltransferase
VKQQIDKQKLAALIEQVGLPATPARQEQLLAYLELLSSHGKRLGLGAGAIGAAVWPHLVKSIWLAGEMFHVKQSSLGAWLDVGSGGGIPALPIRILLGAGRLTMLEPRLKRSLFLEEAARVLQLPDVTIERSRWQDYLPHGAARFSCVTAQGIGGLADSLRSVGGYLSPAGKFICWRGTALERELTSCGKLMRASGLFVSKVEQIDFAGKRWATMMIVEKVGMK